MTAFSLTGTSSNNAVGYEKHHHKHLGWSTLPLCTGISNNKHLHIFKKKKQSYVSSLHLSDQPDLSLSYDHNTTSDIRPLLFDLLSSHLNQDQIWPFKTYSCYLRSAKPRIAASVMKSFGRRVWRTWSTQPKKQVLFFVSLCGVCERMEQRVLMVRRSRGEQGEHQSCLSNVSQRNKEPVVSLHSFKALSLPITHSYSHTHTLWL